MAVSAGYYRHRMKILDKPTERDEFGAPTGDDILISNPWCRAKPLAETEVGDKRVVAQELIEFEMRYSKSVSNPTASMFIEYRGVKYDIITVLNVMELDEKLRIVAKRR